MVGSSENWEQPIECKLGAIGRLGMEETHLFILCARLLESRRTENLIE